MVSTVSPQLLIQLEIIAPSLIVAENDTTYSLVDLRL